MNAIQLRDRIDFYNDLTRNARYFFSDYEKAFNDIVKIYVDNQFAGKNGQNGFQFVQEGRDNIYTLIKTISPTITNGTVITTRYGTYTPSHINYPADYYDFISLDVLIDGYTDYCRPTDYNKEGPLLDNSFMKPTNQKTYYNEDSLGWHIWRGVGGVFTSANLTYLKNAQPFILSTESNLINAGTAIVNGSVYIATEESIQNNIKYVSGAQFTAVGTTLTSGQVILASNTQTTDLPEKVQETLCKMASDCLLGVSANYNASAFVEKETSKNN